MGEFVVDCRHIVLPGSSSLQSAALNSYPQPPKWSPTTNHALGQPLSSVFYGLKVKDSHRQHRCMERSSAQPHVLSPKPSIVLSTSSY